MAQGLGRPLQRPAPRVSLHRAIDSMVIPFASVSSAATLPAPQRLIPIYIAIVKN
jgi:hypothetical protein